MSVFRNKATLMPDYIPPEIPHRHEKFLEILEYFKPVISGETYFEHVFIIGNTGTGKTLVARYLERHINALKNRRADVIYVNARFERIPGNIVRKLLKWVNPFAPDRGYSVEDIYKYFLEILDKNDQRVLLILDDSDHLFEKYAEFIYKLGRVHEIGLVNRLSILFILRSNVSINKADLWAIGGLRKNIVYFEDYGYEELVDILDYRASQAFKNGAIDEGAVETAADIAATYNYNARYAIELLLKAGMIADKKREKIVTAEHIRLARFEVPPSFTYEDMKALTLHEKIVLYALSEILADGEKSFTTTGELERKYKEVAKYFDVSPVGHTWFWKMLDTLHAFGIISKRPSSKKFRGRTTLIGLPSFSATVLLTKLQEMIEDEIIKSLE